jgi:hypothetical protein
MTRLSLLVAVFCVGCMYDLSALGPDLTTADGGVDDAEMPLDDAQVDVPDAVAADDGGQDSGGEDAGTDSGIEMADAGTDAGMTDAGCSVAADCPASHACWMGECHEVGNACSNGTQCDSTICITSSGCTAHCEDDSDCPTDGRYRYSCRFDFGLTDRVCGVDGLAE